MRARRILRWLPLLALIGCYDHRWTQARREQRRAAEGASGAEVTGGEERRPIRYVGRIRFYATPEYQARNGEWQHNVDEWLEEASAIVGPAASVRVEVADMRTWQPRCPSEDLDVCLDELRHTDPADDVDWVFGLLAAQPRFTDSFEHLGVAARPGRHAVLRDLHDPAERAAIEEAFRDLGPERRSEVARRRRHHKRLVLFLHEWAHTLGALHTRDRETLLFPQYSDEMSAFSEGTLALIEAGLVDHFERDLSYASLRAAITAAPDDEWLNGERDTLIGLLDQAAEIAASAASRESPTPAPAGAPQHRFLVPGRTEDLLRGLPAEDQERYGRAVRALLADDLETSWSELQPLLDRYPQSYAIQMFGCSMSMQLGKGDYVHATCDRALQLASTQGP